MIILFAVIYLMEAKCELQFDLLVQTKTWLLRSYLNKLRAPAEQSSFNSEFSGFSGMIKRRRMLARSVIQFSQTTETHWTSLQVKQG